MTDLSPCLKKQCGWCCDPVKVFIGTKIPKVNGKEIWVKQNEIRIPEQHIETVKLEIYKCLLYDPEKKQCMNYKERPAICCNTSCIVDGNKDIDGQYEELISQTFLVIKK